MSHKRGLCSPIELPAVRRRKREAFTLIELLVVIAIIMVLVSIAIPSFMSVMEYVRQTKCASNLEKILKDMQNYAMQEETFFPNALPEVTAGQNTIGINRRQAVTDKAGASRSLFLLARDKFTVLDAFICPGGEEHAVYEDTKLDQDWDFASPLNVSYSYQDQKDYRKLDDTADYFPLNGGWDAPFVVLADRSPIFDDPRWTASGDGWECTGAAGAVQTEHKKPSTYHGGESFNFVRLDGSNGESAVPEVGVSQDNIWTRRDLGARKPDLGNVVTQTAASVQDSILK